MKIWSMAVVTIFVSIVAGCSRPTDVGFVSSQAVQKLKPELRKQVRGILLDQCGTPRAPILLGSGRSTSAHLKQGSAVYSKYCVQCHGVTGDGNGPAAVYMLPEAARLSARRLQVYIHAVRGQAPPRRPDPDRETWDSRDVDAVICTVAPRRS